MIPREDGCMGFIKEGMCLGRACSLRKRFREKMGPWDDVVPMRK
jgi:hypothetical protein